MTTRHGSARVTLPSATEILITRCFEAPAALVWEAITDPRLVRRWWGPSWCPIETCEIDLRVGGTWRYTALMEGRELGWHGTYRELEPGRRIVTTEVFEGFPDAESVNIMTLTEADGVTTLQTLVAHRSQANRDGHLQSGMEGGMQDTFNRLEDLLAAADTPAERFRRVAGRFSDVAHRIDALGPGGWSRPVPCAGWVARDVVTHLVGWVPFVIGRSGLPVPSPSEADAAAAPAAAWDQLAAGLQGLLDDPASATTEFDAGPPGRLTVEGAIGMIVLGDVLVHTWDLARSIGLDVRLDPVIVPGMLAGMEPIDEMLRGSGHYGPRVGTAPDADVQERLIAFTGRDPSWAPPAA